MSVLDIAKEFWKQASSYLPPRARMIILLFVLFGVGAFSIKHYEIPTSQLLIPSFIAPFIAAYLAFEFWDKRLARWLLTAAAVAMFAGWGYWFYFEATKDANQVRRLMADAAGLKAGGDSVGSLKKYQEARIEAQKNKLPKEEMNCLYEMGDLRYLMSDYKGAGDDFRDCQQLAIQLKDTAKKAYTLSRLGDIARFSGDTGLACRLLEEARRDFVQVRDIKGQALAYRGLGDVELRRNTTIAREHFDTARQLAVQAQDRLGEADALAGLADLNSLVGHTVDARNGYSQALEIYKQIRDSDGEGDVYRGLGDLNRRVGSLVAAERNYDEAFGAYQRANDKGGQADAYRGMGDCALIRSLNDKDLVQRARAKYEMAMSLFQEIGDKNGRAVVQLGLGELEHQTNKERAKSYYVDAYNVYLDTQSKEGQGTALRHWGDLDASQNQSGDARAHYQGAIDAYTEVNSQIGQAEVHKSLGDLETKLNKLSEARASYQAALNLYRQVDDLHGVGQIQKALGDVEILASAKARVNAAAKIREAQRYYESALQAFESADNKLGQAVTLDSKAIADRKGKDLDAARENLKKALALYSYIGISKPTTVANTNQLILATAR